MIILCVNFLSIYFCAVLYFFALAPLLITLATNPFLHKTTCIENFYKVVKKILEESSNESPLISGKNKRKDL